MRSETIRYHFNCQAIRFLCLVKAELKCEKLSLQQPSLDRIVDGLLRLCRRVTQFFVIKELDSFVDLSIQNGVVRGAYQNVLSGEKSPISGQ